MSWGCSQNIALGDGIPDLKAKQLPVSLRQRQLLTVGVGWVWGDHINVLLFTGAHIDVLQLLLDQSNPQADPHLRFCHFDYALLCTVSHQQHQAT